MKKMVLYFTIIVYLYLLVDVIIFKTLSSPLELFDFNRPWLRSVHMIPFKDMWDVNASVGSNRINILGNIALFIPLGIYLSMLFSKNQSSLIKNIAIIALLSLFFELFQFIFAIGVTDINDVILNVSGGLLGILIYKLLIVTLKEERAKKLIISLGGVVAVLMVLLEMILTIVNRT